MSESVRYDPSIFSAPRTFEEALACAITTEADVTTARRMAVETPYFVDLIDQHIKLGPGSRVLDYGCGPGRISKEILIRHDVRVYGADISPRMLAFAMAHTNNPRFLAMSPVMLDEVMAFDAIIATWVLQHIPDVERTLGVLISKLKPNGRLFVVNANRHIIPVSGGWHQNEDVDVLEIIRSHMKQVAFSATLDPEKTSPGLSTHAWWGVFESRVAWSQA